MLLIVRVRIESSSSSMCEICGQLPQMPQKYDFDEYVVWVSKTTEFNDKLDINGKYD